MRIGFENQTASELHGSPQGYSAFLAQWVGRIPDQQQQEQMRKNLSLENLREQFARGASRFSYEYRLRMESGQVHWVVTIVRVLMDTDTHELVGFMYTRDVNQKKIVEKVFSRLVDCDYLFVTGVDTNNGSYSMYLIDQDDSYRPMAKGDDFAQAATAYAKKAVHPQDQQRYIQMTNIGFMTKKLDSQGPYHFFYRSLDRAGTYRLCRLTVRYIDEYTKDVCIASLLALENQDFTVQEQG